MEVRSNSRTSSRHAISQSIQPEVKKESVNLMWALKTPASTVAEEPPKQSDNLLSVLFAEQSSTREKPKKESVNLMWDLQTPASTAAEEPPKQSDNLLSVLFAEQNTAKEEPKKESTNLMWALKTPASTAAEEPQSQNPFMQHIDNSIEEAKQDYDRVIDSFEKEGATPAVLDGIAGTANLGKNIIKTVSATTDTLCEYAKTGQEDIDNIASDGIGKTASGIVGFAGETLATVGSLFSTKEGSTTAAVERLGEETEKVIEGGKNIITGTASGLYKGVLGIFGKGWAWGKDDETPVEEKISNSTEVPKPVLDDNEPEVKPVVDDQTVAKDTPEEKPEGIKKSDVKPVIEESVEEKPVVITEPEVKTEVKPEVKSETNLAIEDNTLIDDELKEIRKVMPDYEPIYLDGQLIKPVLDDEETEVKPVADDTPITETVSEENQKIKSVLSENNNLSDEELKRIQQEREKNLFLMELGLFVPEASNAKEKPKSNEISMGIIGTREVPEQEDLNELLRNLESSEFDD